jgi:hypothetical protein
MADGIPAHIEKRARLGSRVGELKVDHPNGLKKGRPINTGLKLHPVLLHGVDAKVERSIEVEFNPNAVGKLLHLHARQVGKNLALREGRMASEPARCTEREDAENKMPLKDNVFSVKKPGG